MFTSQELDTLIDVRRHACVETASELVGICLVTWLIRTLRLFHLVLLETGHTDVDEALTLADGCAGLARRIAAATGLLCGLVHSGTHGGRLGHQLI